MFLSFGLYFITTVVTAYLLVTKSSEMLTIFAWKNAEFLGLILYYVFERCLNFQKTRILLHVTKCLLIFTQWD